MENQESLWSKIKKHLKEHKEAYIVGGAGILLTAITYALMNEKQKRMVIDCGSGSDTFEIRPVSIMSKQQANTNITKQTISVYGNKIGRPGIPVIDTTTNKRYESLTLAATDIGATVNNVREQLNGRTDHINGHKFEVAA